MQYNCNNSYGYNHGYNQLPNVPSHEVEQYQRGYADNTDNNQTTNDNNHQASRRTTPYDRSRSRTWTRPGRQPSPSRHGSKRPKRVEVKKPKSMTNLYIKNLKEDDSDATLWKLVEELGPVKTVKAMVKTVLVKEVSEIKCTGNQSITNNTLN